MDVHNEDRKPNLFIIGASKCGTSALHRYLSFHPQVSMSTTKEPCYFVDPSELKTAWPAMARLAESHDLDAYLSLFDTEEPVKYRGEASVYYSQAPHRSGCARRIHEFAPQARLIYLVKDPVTRTIGHYWQRAKELQETLPLDSAVRENPIYRDTSDYALQLSEYLKYFDRGQILIIDAADLKAKRVETMNALLDWLEVSPFEFTDSQLAARHVSSPQSRVQRFPFVRSIRDSGLWAMARERMPASARKALSSAATVKIERSETDDTETKAWLTDYFADRISAFEEMTGRRFSLWTKSAELLKTSV